MRELILRLNQERQITVLISSHILDELARLATHYGFIDAGHMVKEISAAELENACRKCLRLQVNDTRLLPQVLDTLHIEYHVLSGSEVDIFAPISLSRLARKLDSVGCEIITARERDESLESYYINLLGGVRHE